MKAKGVGADLIRLVHYMRRIPDMDPKRVCFLATEAEYDALVRDLFNPNYNASGASKLTFFGYEVRKREDPEPPLLPILSGDDICD